MRPLYLSCALLLVFSAISASPFVFPNLPLAESVAKPRVVITTDGEVDDVDSFIRYLLYTNEFNTEALIYSSSQWHYAGDSLGTLFTSKIPHTAELYGERKSLRWPGVDWMETYIGKYAEVYGNLASHDPEYPNPNDLLKVISIGNIEFEGEMEKDTDGSNAIKKLLLDDNPQPLHLQAWGGTNTIARALKSIEEEYADTANWVEIYQVVSQKAILYMVSDQDVTYENYIAPRWPDIQVIHNTRQFSSFAYSWKSTVPEAYRIYLGGDWFSRNIRFKHGPLLEEYYLWGDGKKIPNDFDHRHGEPEYMIEKGYTKYDFISEGDSPAFLHLFDFGLRSAENPSYGGWGGRYEQSELSPSKWTDGEGATDINLFSGEDDKDYPQTRWVEVIQNDFAARADWCVSTYEEANHPPIVKLKHDNDLTLEKGSIVKLKGSARDPDDDALIYSWWQYKEADTYEGEIFIKNPNKATASFVVPNDAKPGQTIHIILEVRDERTLFMTRYQRVIVTVE